MKEEIAWSYSMSDEIWHGGPCRSEKECIEEAIAEELNDDDQIAFGVVERYKVTNVNSDMLIEYLQCDAYDAVGEVSDDWLDSITSEQRAELEKRVFNVVTEWLKEINEEPSFYKIYPYEELTIKEAKEKYCQPSEKGPVGKDE